MKNECIEGIGTVQGGEYDRISIEGVGKLKGMATANKLTAEGLFKSKGKLVADEVHIEGMARVFRNMKLKSIHIEGLLKVRRANISAAKIKSEGLLTSTGEVLADEIIIDGLCSVAKMYGDKVTINSNTSIIQGGLSNDKLRKILSLGALYFGRKIDPQFCVIDQLECSSLKAIGLKSKLVKADSVSLQENCIIEYLYCDGDINIDSSCRVKRIISKNPAFNGTFPSNKPLTINQDIEINKEGEEELMVNNGIKKILDLYKNGKINAKEAEIMLSNVEGVSKSGGHIVEPQVPWEDDGKLRIVAYVGRKLLKRGDPQANRIEVKYDGEALNVDCYGSLSCRDVMGDVHAGGGVKCGNVKGSVSCGGGITCNDIGGNASCGGGMTCGNVSGNVSAGGGVTIKK